MYHCAVPSLLTTTTLLLHIPPFSSHSTRLVCVLCLWLWKKVFSFLCNLLQESSQPCVKDTTHIESKSTRKFSVTFYSTRLFLHVCHAQMQHPETYHSISSSRDASSLWLVCLFHFQMFEKEMGKKETTHKIKKRSLAFFSLCSLSVPLLRSAASKAESAIWGILLNFCFVSSCCFCRQWLCTLVKKTVVVDLIQLIY